MFALNCPLGIVNCFVDPCEIAQQNGCYGHPNAVCQSDYCGGCHARWYENGHIVICGTQSIG
ncbi:hypothetical protein DPMN_185443 [Dreissena polymorpha]|uniref:Uncharacterized protein n=1 Tax=Dreissena polymorpha TaxID=45954 RepID=A0A9D4DM83_DREPO|nr:hypothetical protein DPMN_185443 [Dreissena polymorpha]